MIYFVLSVLFTVCLYLIMRAYPRFGVDSFQAIVFNYFACVITGLILTPDLSVFKTIQYNSTGTLFTFFLGFLFVIVFLLIGLTAQKVSVTASSLAANMSLVIPVIFGLFIFQNNNKTFTLINYLGLILAVVALGLGSFKKGVTSKNQSVKFILASMILPLLTFLGTGANNTLINYLTFTYYKPHQNTIFMIVACFGAMVIGSLILIYKIIFQNNILKLKNIIGGFLLGVPNFLSLYFLLKALVYYENSAAFVFPIYNILTMLVSSLAAFLIYTEKLTLINKLGLLIAMMAILMISYQELGLQL